MTSDTPLFVQITGGSDNAVLLDYGGGVQDFSDLVPATNQPNQITLADPNGTPGAQTLEITAQPLLWVSPGRTIALGTYAIHA